LFIFFRTYPFGRLFVALLHAPLQVRGAQLVSMAVGPKVASTKKKSSRSSKACTHRFVNNSPFPVEALWLDYDGNEKLYAVIQPNNQYAQGMASPQSELSTRKSSV
jgi:hypothetical protein